MALLSKRFGAHLSEHAKEALNACPSFPVMDAFFNPVTRQVARDLAERPWKETLKQIDFPYTMEDACVGEQACVRYGTPTTDASKPLIIYLHAGAFVAGSPYANAATALTVCERSGCAALGIRYSLAPEAAFPVQLEEVDRVYRALIDGPYTPERIIVMGDSAGGALALSCVNRWRRDGAPQPAGIVLLSPLTDAAGQSDTILTLADHDPMFNAEVLQSMGAAPALYAPGRDMTDPEISPVHADYHGAPPMLIHVGSREVLLGDSARLAERARHAGVDVTLRVFDGMFHLFHMHWRLEEARASAQGVADFIGRTARQRA